jgi:hypothetical protein
MLSPIRIVKVARENPKVCKEIWWGRRLSCVQVDLSAASAVFVKSLLKEAWNYKKARRKE